MSDAASTARAGCKPGDISGCRVLPNFKESSELIQAAYKGWLDDRAPRLGASLAFYTLLSLAPMVIVVVAIAGLAYGEEAAQGRLIWQIQDLVGWQGAVAIQGLLKSAHQPMTGWLPTIAGIIALFFGATAVVNELRDALNTIWKVPDLETTYWKSVVDIVRVRALSFAMVIGIGFLLMVSLLISAWLSAMGAYFGRFLPVPGWILAIAYSLVSFVVIAFLFALLYKVLPDTRVEWTDVAVGAAATSILFTIGKLLLGLYLGRTGVASTYGAAGSLVVVLLWVYYSAQIFFFGAEFTCVYTNRFGSVFRRNLTLNPPAPEKQIIVLDRPAAGEQRPVELVVPESFR